MEHPSTLARGALALALAWTVPGAAEAQSATRTPPLVFDRVTVVDVERGKLIPEQRVVIVGHRIQAIGDRDAVKTPEGAKVENASGQYLMPGLWDMHVHPREYADVAYSLFIANGVTGARDAASNIPLATLGQWKREIAAGTRVGPRLLVSGPSIDQAPDEQADAEVDEGQPSFLNVPMAVARQVVDSLHAAGADMIKTYEMSREMYLMVAAEARRVGMPFGGHFENIDPGEASDSGATFLDHGLACRGMPSSDTNAAAAPCAALAQRLRRNNTWVTMLSALSMAFPARARSERFLPDSLLNSPSDLLGAALTPNIPDPDPPPSSTADWAKARAMPGVRDALNIFPAISALHKSGVPMVVGTDTYMGDNKVLQSVTPGFSVHEALVSFVLAGMTPLEALQAATLNPARALRATDSLGTVAAGKLADLVLLDADPLADIWHTTRIRAVVANGRYFDRAALDQLLADAHAKAKR